MLNYITVSVYQFTEIITSLILPLTTAEQDHRVAQYSPRYRLSFTLLNEDAAAGHSVSEWAVADAISRKRQLTFQILNGKLMHRVGHISPILKRLSVLHNFTIESQVQFHAPLAFKPLPVDSAFGITSEDLTVFVNSAEWTLCDYTLWPLLSLSKSRLTCSVQHIKRPCSPFYPFRTIDIPSTTVYHEPRRYASFVLHNVVFIRF